MRWTLMIGWVLAVVVAPEGIGEESTAGDPGSRERRIQQLAFAGPALAGSVLVWGRSTATGRSP